MKVGVTVWFQNMPDMLERGMKNDYSKPIVRPDVDVMRDEFGLCDLIEPLGFDRMWTIEHHVSPYGMTVTPTQIFSYMAGRTSKIGFGSMVMVLPWHNPIRLAGEIALLDNMLDGRDLRIGVGRGAAPHEFDAFEVDYGESRERLAEILEILRLGLTQEWFEYNGEHYKIPRTTIRPRPTKDLTSQMLMAWSSPDSRAFAANSGVSPIFNNFHNWEEVVNSTNEFNAIREGHGWHPVAPVVAGPMFCSMDKEKVRQAREWVKMTYDSSIWHYGLMNQPSMKKKLAGKTGKELEDAIEEIRARSLVVGAFGTPDEILETLSNAQDKTQFAELICQVNFGLMPYEWAHDSMKLFAKEVLPELKKIEPKGTIDCTPYADVVASRERETQSAPAAAEA
ncbi:LLM class flavin-dependent oxidoreductase [Marinovum sp.]|uniref:LLM class flavin-dependent oxidoreductase n=1 Tax=Marinovum sp. TaxID=2024839 RepID=UPI003A927287